MEGLLAAKIGKTIVYVPYNCNKPSAAPGRYENLFLPASSQQYMHQIL
jgi:hypothetical protein